MRRPVSPSPRRSQDSRSRTPPPRVTQLRRSASDISYRPNRFLAKLKQAGASSASTSNTGASSSATGALVSQKAPSHLRTGSNSALILPTSAPPTSASGSKATTNINLKGARDMHRLGTLPAQATLAPAMPNPASASSLSLASTLTNNTVTAAVSSTTDPWHMLHVHVLPLFNGEPLKMPIEELNQLVKKHISTVVSRSLSRAISSLEQDITGLLLRGMVTLNVKLSELDDKKLLPRLAEVWEFFWHGILPYVEGVFHPLKTDKLMQSLSRTPKSNRPSSPKLPDESHTASSTTQFIDVRVLALRSFRDSIILPVFSRLHVLISSTAKERDYLAGSTRSYLPKLQQMLLVLVSSAQHCHCLATQSAAPPQGESAAVHLLRAIRSPHAVVSSRPFSVARQPTFFSGAAPRDRRGRIARKSGLYASNPKTSLAKWDDQGSDDNDDETPRGARFGVERDREKEFLESLRSPELDPEDDSGVGGPAGGWGLGRGQEHQEGEDDDEEETLEWEQAQDVVERMVGLRG